MIYFYQKNRYIKYVQLKILKPKLLQLIKQIDKKEQLIIKKLIFE